MNCPTCNEELISEAEACAACGWSLSHDRTAASERVGALRVLDGKWLIERKLGQGGMGTVYQARDLELERPVAIKMLANHLLNEPEIVTRFEREARIMARLDHPNLVPVYAVGRHEGVPYIVMKLLEGKSLNQILAETTRLPSEKVLPLLKQLCEGLQFVHDQRVVHRDVKPANIYVSSSGHVTLLDLGVARDADSAMTRTGMLMGTPRYMAPEQIVGKTATTAADIYALAALTFEAVTGQPVFHAETDFELMRKHVDQAPPDASTLVALPAAVGVTLSKGMAKLPAERHASAFEFYRDFAQAWNSGPPITPAPTGSPRAVPELATPMPTVAPLVVPRNRAPAAIAGGLGVLALGAIAFFAWPSGQHDRQSTAPAPQVTGSAPQVTGSAPQLVAPAPQAAAPVPQPTGSAPPPNVPAQQPVGSAQQPTAPVPQPPAPTSKPAASGPQPKAETPTPQVVRPKPAPTAVTFAAKAAGEPVAAFVDIDGERERATPFVKALMPGQHTIIFRRSGMPPVQRTITVVAGKEQKVLVEMEK